MWRYLVVTVLCIVFLLPVASAFAQQKDDRIVVSESDIPPDLLAQIKAKQTVEKYGKWAGFGREIGQAVDGALSAVTKNAQEFAKTDVGKLTIFLVIWKVIGEDFVQLAVGLLLLFIGIPIFIWLTLKNGLKRRILKSVENGKKEYEISDPGAEAKWAYGVAFFVYIIMVLIVIFA